LQNQQEFYFELMKDRKNLEHLSSGEGN